MDRKSYVTPSALDISENREKVENMIIGRIAFSGGYVHPTDVPIKLNGVGNGSVNDALALADRYRYALQRIIDRSNTGEPGTSKVLDMRKIAEEALRG